MLVSAGFAEYHHLLAFRRDLFPSLLMLGNIALKPLQRFAIDMKFANVVVPKLQAKCLRHRSRFLRVVVSFGFRRRNRIFPN